MAGRAADADVSGEEAGPASFLLGADGRLHRDLAPEALRDAFAAGGRPLWVDIDARRDGQWRLLTDLFRFHPLAVEDTRSPDCRVKLEEYEGYLFLVVRGIDFAEETPEPYDIEPRNLYLFLGENFLVTVHAGPFASVEAVRVRVETGAEPMTRGIDHLAYALVDALIDLYFPLLDRIDEFLDELEDQIFDGDREQMGRIFDLKRTLVSLRRHLAPMREVMASVANRPLPFLRPETQIYFRDVHDHVIRQLEAVETYRELLTGAMEVQLTVLSNRMNEIIKALSIIATVILPPTLIASIYGMNFEWMPGLHHPAGFWIVLGVMSVITGTLVLYAWWKNWL